MTVKRKWLLGLLPVLILVGILASIYIQRDRLRQVIAPPAAAQIMRAAPAGCDLGSGPCGAVDADGRHVSAELQPRPVRTMERLRFTIRVDPALAPLQEAQVDFTMPGMDMGVNRFTLRPEAPTQWAATAMLPICTQGGSDWRATLLLRDRNGRLWQAQWPLHVAGGLASGA